MIDSAMADVVYSMSFTTGALLYRESLTVAALHAEMSDCDAVRARVIAENLLQMRTHNALQRVYREVSSRLRLMTPLEMELLLDGSQQEQGYVLWLAACKRYRFIYDFAVEVLREKFLSLDYDLTREDYDRFFLAKAEWHPEVERVAPVTRAKGRQFVFKMLREADLLSKQNRILPALLTPRLVDAIATDSPAHLAVFPVAESVVRGWAR